MISVIIPSYNRKSSILALLEDIHRQEQADFEIIVVDDCSPDGSAEAIAEAFPDVTLLRNEKNGGPCVTRNRGIRAARGEYIVGFDSDVSVPDVHLLKKTMQMFEAAPEASGFAFRLFKPDGATDDVERWWHPLPISKFVSKPFETSYFSGTAYAFRRSAVQNTELFPELLYIHYEEVILAFRIIDAGGRIYYNPCLSAVHHASPTTRRNKIQTFYKTRSQIILAYLCYPFLKGVIYLAPRLAFNFVKAVSGGYLADFTKSIFSALQIVRSASAIRQPLSRDTWKKLSFLADQSRPCELPNSLEREVCNH